MDYLDRFISDGITDNTAAFTEVLRECRLIELAEGDYLVGNLVIPENTTIRGAGAATRLIFSRECTGAMLTVTGDNVHIRDCHLIGGCIEAPKSRGERTAVSVSMVAGVQLSDVRVKGFNLCGLYATHIGARGEGVFYRSLKITNCEFDYNYVGIYFDTRTEFAQVIGTDCAQNHVGMICAGGNNITAACFFNHNTIGFLAEGGADHPNHGHQTVSHCEFAHNLETGFMAREIAIGFILTGCQLFHNAYCLKNSTGVLFTSGEMGSAPIIVEGGGWNAITNSYFHTAPSRISVTDNSLFSIQQVFGGDGSSYTYNK